MKKNYIFIAFLFLTTLMVGQNKDFVPTSGVIWSDANNWSPTGVPDITNNVRLPGTIESDLDINLILSRLQTVFGTGNTGGTETIIAGLGVLTIDAGSNANTAKGIANLSGNGINLIFRGSVIIDNSTTTGIKNTLLTFGNNASNQYTFDDGSNLTLNTPLEARSGAGAGNYSFNGVLSGAGALRLNANTTITFGSTSDNSGRTGDFVWVGPNTSVVVNTADNGVFIPSGQKIQSNADNGSIVINGVNVYRGNIGVDGSRSFTFDVNENQNSMEGLQFTGAGAGTLNIDIDNSITELFFADNSAIDWASGTVNITGYQEGVVRFGTDNAGLTTAQLAQITVDGTGGPVALDADGYLVNESSLSVDDFEAGSAKPIAFPTLVDEVLFFNKVQNNVKIVDLNGRVLFSSAADNQTEVSVDFLNTGIYLIIFDNKKTQKFIKK